MRYAIIFVCLLGLGGRISAQDAAAAKETGKASLEGVVIKEPGGEPLKKAIVELIAENQDEGGNYTATSDPEGQFKIAGIQPGRYRRFIERPGYLEVDEKRRRSQGIVLSFEAGQRIKDQTLRMLAAAIITGRVLDEDGDPMPDVEVIVWRRKFAAGRGKFEAAGEAQTNDLGEFRIGGLMMGKYYLSASPAANFQSLLPPQKTVDESGIKQPERAYVNTYYPNTPESAQAAALELHAGEEVPVDFTLARIRTASIRGTVVGLAPGANANILLRSHNARTVFMSGRVEKDGKFDIDHVAPGPYTIMALSEGAEAPQSTFKKIEVADSDIEGVRLVLSAGATVRGRIRLGEKMKGQTSALYASLHRIDGEEDSSDDMVLGDDPSMNSSAAERVKPDGTFEMKNIPAGLYEIEVSGESRAMSDWYVESALVGTKQTVETGLNVNGGAITLDLMLSPGAGVLNGSVVNEKKEPVANAVVVAVPEDKFRNRQSHYQKGATDQDGRFTLRGLRPGKYSLYAWEVLDGDDYLDPEFVKQFESRGTPVNVEKASRQTVALKVIPAATEP